MQNGASALHDNQDPDGEEEPDGEEDEGGNGAGDAGHAEGVSEGPCPEDGGKLLVSKGQGPKTEVGGDMGNAIKAEFKKSAQCSLLRRSSLSVYKRRMSLTRDAASATSSLLRLTVVRWFRAALRESLSVFISSVHHRLAYGDGLALATCSSRISLTIASSLLTVTSKSSLADNLG